MWKDIDLNLTKQKDGDITANYDSDAIINSLRNITQTMQGSRRMLPTFAVPFWSLLFEPVDEQTGYSIGNYLIDAISSWDNRIELTKVNVVAVPDQGQYDVTMNFNIKNSIYEPKSFQFILKQQG